MILRKLLRLRNSILFVETIELLYLKHHESELHVEVF